MLQFEILHGTWLPCPILRLLQSQYVYLASDLLFYHLLSIHSAAWSSTALSSAPINYFRLWFSWFKSISNTWMRLDFSAAGILGSLWIWTICFLISDCWGSTCEWEWWQSVVEDLIETPWSDSLSDGSQSESSSSLSLECSSEMEKSWHSWWFESLQVWSWPSSAMGQLLEAFGSGGNDDPSSGCGEWL